MKYQLKRIDTWSAVKITFVIAGAVGFVVGALYAVLITLMASLGRHVWDVRRHAR